MPFTLVQIEKLRFRYALSETDALRGVELSLREGDFCVLFGPSGSGKTTLLRHLKRELAPVGVRSGRVLFRGQELFSSSAQSVSEIGLVMQNPDSQIVTETVWQELAFGLENLGLPSGVIRRRVAEMAGFFGIEPWFHKKTETLSGGQKQLLNLASVLAMQPRLLLLDEPTAQLDPIAAREFIEMLRRLNRELGVTVLLSEHRLDEALPAANLAVLMENGAVKAAAAPRELPSLLLQSGDGAYLRCLPAPARIFARSSGSAPCPITVREGRERLQSLVKSRPQLIQPPEQAGEAPAKKTFGTPALSFRDVTFRYEKDAPDVLANFSMRAEYGELLCVLGGNGSGKSTLLRLAAGLLRPLAGRVEAGRPAALLPQNPKAVFLHDTLRAELGARAQADAERFGLSGLLDRHPYDLSGGEQQRAALARVLQSEPRLLLLDEPTKGLDALSKDGLARLLRELCGQGVCVVVSTHDVEFAARHADRCLLLFDGATACSGDARSFFAGNFFYTTAANRIARDVFPGAVTCEDVRRLCGLESGADA